MNETCQHTWTEEEEAAYQRKLYHLARYVANHPRPRYFASRLAERHGPAFVQKLRDRLKEGRP